jgi:hypothetical protein
MLSARGPDLMLRAALASISLVAMLYPDDTVALGTAVVVALATCYGTYRHGLIARPKSTLAQMPVT